jgi:hypothetical protein
VHVGGGGPGVRAGGRVAALGGLARARVHVGGRGVPGSHAGRGGLAPEGEQGEAEGSWRRRRRGGRGRVVRSGDTVRRRGVVGRLRGGATPAPVDGGRTPPRPGREVAQRGTKKILFLPGFLVLVWSNYDMFESLVILYSSTAANPAFAVVFLSIIQVNLWPLLLNRPLIVG